MEFVKLRVLAMPTHTCDGQDGDASRAHNMLPGLWTMPRGSASSTVGESGHAGRELAARLAPCPPCHFPRIVPLLRLDQIDSDNHTFSPAPPHRQPLFLCTTHPSAVYTPTGEAFP